MSMPESEFVPFLGDMDGRRGGGNFGESLPPVVEEDDRLISFLKNLGLEKYAEVFQGQDVDYNTLMSLSDDDLKNIGIK